MSIRAELQQAREASGGQAAIEWLKEAVLRTNDEEEKIFLLARLASEYQRIGVLGEAERAIRQQTSIRPAQPEIWIQLAEHFLYHVNDLTQARDAAETAIAVATSTRDFVRQAHAVAIRVALRTGDFSAVATFLQTLVDYEPPAGSIDIALEGDFLDQIPERAPIDRSIIHRYRERVQRENGNMRV